VQSVNRHGLVAVNVKTLAGKRARKEAQTNPVLRWDQVRRQASVNLDGARCLDQQVAHARSDPVNRRRLQHVEVHLTYLGVTVHHPLVETSISSAGE
jgi:hypothetical protein